MVNPIVVTHCEKASPLHKFDCEARLDCSDETGLVVGYGQTEEEAINDLVLQLGCRTTPPAMIRPPARRRENSTAASIR